MIIPFAEVQLIRRRAVQVTMTVTGTIYWDPLNEGCYLDFLSNNAGTAIHTIDFTYPQVAGMTSASGLEIWVSCKRVTSNPLTLAWPASFLFQTTGDQQPNPNASSLTAWHGFIRPAFANVFMTKIGEWTSIP
jgi:hypothetical protein